MPIFFNVKMPWHVLDSASANMNINSLSSHSITNLCISKITSFLPINKIGNKATDSGKQVSIRSEIHNRWGPLSLLFKNWKELNINRLINTGIDTPRAKARSSCYLYIFTFFWWKRWRSSEVGGGRWRRSVTEVGEGRGSVDVDLRVSCCVVSRSS